MPSKNPAQRLPDIVDASRRLPGELLERHPKIAWPAIAGTGHVTGTNMRRVDVALICHAVQHNLAMLRGVASAEFERFRSFE